MRNVWNKGFGLVGASGTGKSTLARMVANEHLTYVPSAASEVFAQMGFSAKQALTPAERVRLQWAILERHERDVAAVEGRFISDRTPLDMAVYLAMGLHDEHLRALKPYVEACRAVLEKHYAALVLIPAGSIPYQDDAKRPVGADETGWAFDTFRNGLQSRLSGGAFYHLRETDLALRVLELRGLIALHRS